MIGSRPQNASRAVRRVAFGIAVGLVATSCSLAPVDLEAESTLALRTTITAADGTTLTRLFEENRALVDIEAMPQALIDAVLAAEDSRFYEHSGYDLKAIARAAISDIRHGDVVQGGSTITQQYVKNTFFRHPTQTLERKVRELRLAIEVEKQYTKDEILTRYLNTVYFGEGAYGVKAASETYFGHGVGTLSIDEAALLASVIKSPAFYDPRTHARQALGRRNYVLDRMAALGKITVQEAGRFEKRSIGVLPKPPKPTTREPYFVEAVKREVLRDRRLGATEQERAAALYKGGLRIESSLVPEYQHAAKDAVANVLNQPGDPAAALVAIRPSTGEIVAMVGGRDWSQSQVNLALGTEGGGSGRQPGSSFKPIDAAAAMEAGIPLTTRYDSAPAIFRLEDGSTWTVHNAEGGGYGQLPLDEALVHSVNGVYARLALQIGPAAIATQAHLMGVRSHLPIYPSISLGSADVSVLDMAAAYATLANHGTAIEPTTIKRVSLPSGDVLTPDQKVTPAVVSPGNAFLLTKVMEQVIERGTGTAANIGRPAAGKTGTTNEYTDAWFVGFTPELVTAVWVGYPQGTIPMTNVHGIRVFGGTFPAIIWKEFMLSALDGVPIHDFHLPASAYITVKIDPVTGLLAAPWCPGVKRRMLRELAPTTACPLPQPAPATLPSASPSESPGKKHPGGSGAKPSPSPSAHPSPRPSPSPSKGKKN